MFDPAEVVAAAIDVLDSFEAVAAEGDLDPVDVVAIGMTKDVGFELTDDNFDPPFALKFTDFENV